jgi:hypothetical protein
VLHGFGEPPLQVLLNRLVSANDELTGLGLTLCLGEARFDHLTCRSSEESLATVGHAQIGNPAAVAARVDGAFAMAASRYSRSGHEVDILPSTGTQWNALYRWSPVIHGRAMSEVFWTIKELTDEGLEVALQDAA